MDRPKVGDKIFVTTGAGHSDRKFVKVTKLNPKRFKAVILADDWNLQERYDVGVERDYHYNLVRPTDGDVYAGRGDWKKLTALEEAEMMLARLDQQIGKLEEQRDNVANQITKLRLQTPDITN